MFRPFLSVKLVSIILVTLVIAAGCRQSTAPLAENSPSTATPPVVLIPPIQPGDGTDLTDRLLEKGIIRVGIRVWPEAAFSPPAFRGFSNAAIGGAMNGFEVDIARHIANGLGLELELVEAYPPVIANGDWRGEWDIALSSLVPFDPPVKNSVAPLSYSIPYAYMPTGILLPASNQQVNTLAQLSGLNVGVFEHSVYQQLLTPSETSLTVNGQALISPSPPTVQLMVLGNVQKAIRNLGQPSSDKTDKTSPPVNAILGPAPVFQQALEENKLPLRIVLDQENLPHHPLVVAAVPQEGLKVDRLIAEINTIFVRLKRQGTLAEIHLRWYNQDLSQAP